MSLGWPADAEDVRTLYGTRRGAQAATPRPSNIERSRCRRPCARRAVARPCASSTQRSCLPRSVSKHCFHSTHLAGRLRGDGTTSFASLMFCIDAYTMLGDLDRAYAAGEAMAAAGGEEWAIGHSAQCRLLVAGDERVSRGSALRSARVTHGPRRVLAQIRRSRSLRVARETDLQRAAAARVVSPGQRPGTAAPSPSRAPRNAGSDPAHRPPGPQSCPRNSASRRPGPIARRSRPIPRVLRRFE